MNLEKKDIRGNEAVPASSALPSPSLLPDASRSAGTRRWWPWLLGVGVVGLAAFLLLGRGSHRAASAGKSGKGPAVAHVVPVTAAVARTGDLGVYLTGLGTVTAINTVTIRSRVDGQLNQVAFREGQFVHQGDLLAAIDPRPFQVQLIQAEGQRAKDEAGLKNALIDLERYKVLIQQDSIPRQQLDTQAATVNQFEAALKTDEGQVESAKLNLVYSRITAPISGRVGLRLVDVGNMVHASDPNGLVVITQMQPITVLFTIPADRLPPVLQKMRAAQHLTVDAYDRDLKNKLATGSLLAIDNQIDQTTGTVRLKAVFDNEDNPLFPNQFVNARLLVDVLQSAVLIPTAAIQRSPQSTFVYVVKPDSTVDMRNVEVQLTEGDDTSIRRGVSAGEAVVIDGVDKLQPGTKVAANMTGVSGGRKTTP
jgi:multidrug efflux system membrane fusion protein